MATASVNSPKVEELRIVLLGKVGAGKSKVARFLLGSKEPKGEIGSCIIREGEAAGRNIFLVDTPGWNRSNIYHTPEKIKNEIIRSATLCPPGPHALIVVLRVESNVDFPSVKELKTVSWHMELLSQRVWDHTMLLFLCEEGVEEPTVSEHIQKANKLLEKCGNRHYVLRSEDQILELMEEVEKMVEGNCGDFFLPQIYYDYMQSKTPQNVAEMKKMYEDREAELKKRYQRSVSENKAQAEETALRQRRGSLQGLFPEMKESDQTVATEAVLQKEILELVKHYLRPVVVAVIMALMVVIGALLGSVSGAVFGVLGACAGIVIGAASAVPLTLWLINAARVAKDNATILQQHEAPKL